MNEMYKIVVFLIANSLIFVALSDLIVQLPSGTIRGYFRVTPNNTIFNAFQGIPYAKPPLGDLRFQPPQPVDRWDGILEVTKNGNRCYSVAKDTDNENEDCLVINVFTPVLDNTSSPIPVMVFIYGGGFRDGASEYNVYGPDYLIEQGVIMVSFNYRVGPFGFLSTGDKVVPGNMGLKDQVLALKWVQENIRLFGGDPQQVTIFGQSAGGASVGFHIISKQSTGLFRAAIAESGSGVSIWAYIKDPVQYGYELASLIQPNATFNSSEELITFLRTVPAKDIDIASTKTTIINHPLPVIEEEHSGAFLIESMYESLEKGNFNKVPLFIGGNSEEYISLAADMDALKKRMEGYDRNISQLVPTSFHLNNSNDIESVGHKIKDIYIKDGSLWQDNLGLSIAYLSEQHFFNPLVKHAELQSNYTDVYFYKFSYAGVMGNNYNITLEGAEKCTHGEEMYYYFKRINNGYDNSDLSKFSQHDITTHNRMVKLWTNFAKYLNPTPERSELLQNIIWPKVTPSDIKYVNIDQNLEIQSHIKDNRYLHWKELFEKYAQRPYVTF